MKNSPRYILYIALICGALTCSTFALSQSANSMLGTAWHNGRFHVDVASVIGRSDIILNTPNARAKEAMPLGNGGCGVAIWSSNGFSAQLNRADTLPYRYSPGQVLIPGLAALTDATDYSGKLDLYNGEFRESGGGMTATAYVQPHSDASIIDVTGGAQIDEKVSGSTVLFHADAGKNYLIKRADMPAMDSRFIPVIDMSALSAKKLGSAQIGLFRKEQ
jgi:hypothetical protein